MYKCVHKYKCINKINKCVGDKQAPRRDCQVAAGSRHPPRAAPLRLHAARRAARRGGAGRLHRGARRRGRGPLRPAAAHGRLRHSQCRPAVRRARRAPSAARPAGDLLRAAGEVAKGPVAGPLELARLLSPARAKGREPIRQPVLSAGVRRHGASR
ncbi:hypothetical protein T492DRAFT_201215 [Pavlovales sp. CCMP2436]|nr:hypothetical protein T492DRAFT_201215 [Pavlovales sp. CCMP2436]